MSKADFLRKLAEAIRLYKMSIRQGSSKSLWMLSLESAKKAGFVIDPNSVSSENRVEVAIKEITSIMTFHPEDVLRIQALAEEAWEYYFNKHLKGKSVITGN